MAYTKHFNDTSQYRIRLETELQRTGSEYGLSPEIIETDSQTFIKMEDLGEMCIADKYGEKIDDIPDHIRRDIWNILWTLYSCCNIEYVDVTPYNFIEKDGRVWVIDYGHAKYIKRGNVDEWLHHVLSDEQMTLTEWNAHFH
jgi:tRNA A-37 threonylcarbamoyl transferase component Bud32